MGRRLYEEVASEIILRFLLPEGPSMNDIAVAKKCSVAAQWRGILDGYSGHVASNT